MRSIPTPVAPCDQVACPAPTAAVNTLTDHIVSETLALVHKIGEQLSAFDSHLTRLLGPIPTPAGEDTKSESGSYASQIENNIRTLHAQSEWLARLVERVHQV